jgi:rhodanese-related sulfurtransferase
MKTNSISAAQLRDKLAKQEALHLLDVRDAEKFQTGTIEVQGAQTENLPYVTMRDQSADALERMANLPKDAQIVTVCTTGNKAQKAATFLREHGFSAISLEGGLTAWKDKATN